MNKIIIIIPYFGKWPEWIELFFDSIDRNSSIDFHFFTDCDTSVTNAKNVFFHQMSFEDYVKNAQEKLGCPINIPNPYKICDLRPMFGQIHSDLIKPYDFYGWTDVDLLFGNIRSFYTDSILNNHEVFSTHSKHISGHLALFKNNQRNKTIYKSIYNWKEALLNPKFVGIDEHGITNAYTMTFFDKFNEKFKVKFDNYFTRLFKKVKVKKLYFVEQFTTPFTPNTWIDGSQNSDQPSTWYYDQGVVTNNRDNRNFIYIHFMNFKSSQWRHDGTKAPWEGKESILNIKNDYLSNRIVIDLTGIHN